MWLRKDEFVLDRIENGKYILEGECGFIEVDRLPGRPKDGDVYLYANGRFIPCSNTAAARRKYLRERLKRLKERV
jgi:hypothetical protein